MDGKQRHRRETRPLLTILLAIGIAVLASTWSSPVLAQPPGAAATTTPSQTLDASTVENFQRDGIKLNFEDVDIKTLGRIIGQITGRNIVIDQKVQGKVTLVSPNRLSPNEAWEMFVSALEAYGFGVEESDGVYHVSPIATVRQRGTRIFPNAGAKVLVAVIKISKVGSDQAVNALRPLLTPTGVISAIPNSNTVVVMDEAAVVRRMIALAKRIDIATDKASLRIYYPQRVRAADVLKNIESLFPDRNNLRITVHQPTNSLLVLGLPEQHRTIERMLSSLERRNQSEAEPRQFWVFYLQYASAEDTSKILAEMLGERQRLEQQQAQSGIPTAQSPGVTFPITNPQSSVIQPPAAGGSAFPGGNPAVPNSPADPTREYPNPQPTPFQQGAETRTSNTVFPVSPAQLPINQQGFASSKVSADVSNNALVFYMTASEYATVRRLVEQLDIPRKQVLVSAIVAEVSPKRLETAGIQWQATIEGAGIVGLGAGQSLAQLYQTLQAGNFVLGTIDPTTTSIEIGGSTVKFPNNYALLNFLTTTTDFNLLASPRLLTHNNKQADISVGRIVPFATGVKYDINGQPIVNFDYREVGLNLKLTPHISQGQNVRLEVHQDLQEVVDYIKTGSGATAVTVPVVSKREVNSEVSLGDGQTLIIGGLVQRNTLQTIRKVPILGDIPLIGDLLFSQKDRTVSKTTLFVFLTPHIVDSPQKAHEINNQYQQMYERAMRSEKKYNEDHEYHPTQEPRTSPKDPRVLPLPGPGPIPTPEVLPPAIPPMQGAPMVPNAPPGDSAPPPAPPSTPSGPSTPSTPGRAWY